MLNILLNTFSLERFISNGEEERKILTFSLDGTYEDLGEEGNILKKKINDVDCVSKSYVDYIVHYRLWPTGYFSKRIPVMYHCRM